jgi:DNA-binding CsgD family transcriptional regulator
LPTTGIAVLDTSPIVEKLYEAVLDLDLWPDAIQSVADGLGCAGAALLSNARPIGLWVRVDPAARALFENRFVSRNPVHAYVARARAAPGYRPGISTDRDIAASLDLQRTAYFNEFLRPYDGNASLVFDLGVNGITAALNLSRTARQGAFTGGELEAAQALHPHVTRAFWLSAKLAERRRFGDGIFDALERSRFAVFLLDAEGRIAHASARGETLLRERNGLRCERGVLCALRSDATAALHKLVAGAVLPGSRTGGSCSIPRSLRLPLTVTVTPLRSDRSAFFEANSSAIVCVFDPTSPLELSSAHLREAFGLSAAEARVAVKLLEGLDQKEIARALDISFFTVRAHLSQIFQKTHTNRQSEFVGLVMRSIGSNVFGNTQ